jgi:hypothetical protein
LILDYLIYYLLFYIKNLIEIDISYGIPILKEWEPLQAYFVIIKDRKILDHEG